MGADPGNFRGSASAKLKQMKLPSSLNSIVNSPSQLAHVIAVLLQTLSNLF